MMPLRPTKRKLIIKLVPAKSQLMSISLLLTTKVSIQTSSKTMVLNKVSHTHKLHSSCGHLQNLITLTSIFICVDDEQKIVDMYSQEEIENFRMIFIMFDPEKTGFVGIADLETILKSLGRDPDEAKDLVADM